MEYFAQVNFTYSDGTFFQLSKSFDNVHDAGSWVFSYFDLFSDCKPSFDISEFDDLEDL